MTDISPSKEKLYNMLFCGPDDIEIDEPLVRASTSSLDVKNTQKGSCFILFILYTFLFGNSKSDKSFNMQYLGFRPRTLKIGKIPRQHHVSIHH